MVENTKKLSNIGSLIHQRVVIDTSVLLKAVLVEEYSEIVKEIIALHRDMELTLLATPLIFFEFLNALSKRLKDKNLVDSTLKKFFKMKIGVIDAKYGYLWKGIRYACENKQVSFYDSSYHALAMDMDGIFLTADEKYYNLMKNEGNILLLSDLVK